MSSCVVAASVVKILDCCSVRRVFVFFLPCPGGESSEPDSKSETITAVTQREPSETKRANSEILLQHRIWSDSPSLCCWTSRLRSREHVQITCSCLRRTELHGFPVYVANNCNIYRGGPNKVASKHAVDFFACRHRNAN